MDKQVNNTAIAVSHAKPSRFNLQLMLGETSQQLRKTCEWRSVWLITKPARFECPPSALR